MKYFNLSLHRSATKSTGQVFRDSNLSICEWLGWDFEEKYQDLLRRGQEEDLADLILAGSPNATYFGDLPIPLLYREMAARFPTANFFMVLRDLNSWSESSFRHFIYTGNLPENPLGPPVTPLNRLLLDCYGYLERGTEFVASRQFTHEAAKIWRQIYYKHLLAVFNFFATQKVPLVLFYLEDPDIGPKLKEYACPWLDRSICMRYEMQKLHSDDQERKSLFGED